MSSEYVLAKFQFYLLRLHNLFTKTAKPANEHVAALMHS